MHHHRTWHLLGAFLAAGALLFLILAALGGRPHRAYAQGTTLTVNTDDDDNWDGTCDGVHCSLREAIYAANNTGGSEPVTITFAANYTITLTYQSGGEYIDLNSINRPTSGPVVIDGDLNNDGNPDVVLDGQNITQTGSTGLWIKSNDVTVDGMVVENFDCAGCWGLDVHGDNALIINSHFTHDDTGVLLTNDAAYNVITNCIVANNNDDGILISAKYATVSSMAVVTPAHHNTIANSYIGTNAAGDNLGNTNKGIIIQRGAHDNTIQDNVIAYNGCYALHLRGGSGFPTDPFAPPYGNQVLGNEIHHNGATCSPQAAVVNDRTHQPPGGIPTLAGGYDNLFASNTITANTGLGIYNIGASSLITGNTVANNTSYGIYNLPDFGNTYSPAQADDDILSIPIVKNNTIAGNGVYGIYSLDTAPVDRYTLHQDNTLGTHSGLDVIQVWYGAVEVLTGTVSAPQPITQGISVRVMGAGTGWLQDLTTYAPATVYTSGIWGDAGLQYNFVSTWPGIREFEVRDDGTLVNHLTHTVQVYLSGVYTGFVYFSFDGLTTTEPISGDVLIPQWVQTGPYGRYQVPEVNFSRDTDADTIPDVVEGPGDSDNDGQPDYQDADSDNDGIPDATEGAGDTDGDGTPDYLDLDSDGDGIPDATEGSGDTDGDGTPDYLDTDSDNDGIPDSSECPGGSSCLDTDGDGIPDYIESNTQDTDGDGTPNYQDTDSDGDGIPDADEYYAGGGDAAFCSDTTVDTDDDGIPNCQDNDADGDGIPNYLDGDADGDGIPDSQEGTGDSDGDGLPDWLDPMDGADTSGGGDSDGDGISDADEYYTGQGDTPACTDTNVDTDSDGTPDCQDNDVDGDGIPNYMDTDSDGDGIPDSQEGTGDSDNDGIPDWLDRSFSIYLPLIFKSWGS